MREVTGRNSFGPWVLTRRPTQTNDWPDIIDVHHTEYHSRRIVPLYFLTREQAETEARLLVEHCNRIHHLDRTFEPFVKATRRVP